MLSALICGSVDVASTCSTSEVPMPNARAPKAPWVAVCESPHTQVDPGTVKPCVHAYVHVHVCVHAYVHVHVCACVHVDPGTVKPGSGFGLA